MSHPFSEHRQTKVEHSRVGHITRGYKSGGAVKHSDAKQDRKLVKSMIDKAIHPEGHKGKHRMDRPKRAKRAEGGGVKFPASDAAKGLSDAYAIQPWYGPEAQAARAAAGKEFSSSTKRAKGGRVKKGNAKTIVNVITGGHPAGGAVPPGPPMAPPGPPMGIAGPPPGGMPPPMAAKPPMMPPPGGPPPGMPMRAKGGRVQTPTGSGVSPINNSSKKTNGSPVYNASTRNGTQVSDGDGNNKDDSKDMNRGRVVTFASGGKVKSFYAKGGRVESPDGVAKASKLPGGSGGGEGRLAKASRADRVYHGPLK